MSKIKSISVNDGERANHVRQVCVVSEGDSVVILRVNTGDCYSEVIAVGGGARNEACFLIVHGLLRMPEDRLVVEMAWDTQIQFCSTNSDDGFWIAIFMEPEWKEIWPRRS